MEPTSPRHEASTIERRIRIAARPETVFRHWVEPDLLVGWMGRSAIVEAHPGGQFRVDYNGTDVASGAYLEVDPPRRLVLTWGWEAPGDAVPPGASRVEVDFEPDGGGTLLVLRHLGLPGDAVDGHAVGWDQFLPALARNAAGG